MRRGRMSPRTHRNPTSAPTINLHRHSASDHCTPTSITLRLVSYEVLPELASRGTFPAPVFSLDSTGIPASHRATDRKECFPTQQSNNFGGNTLVARGTHPGEHGGTH